MAGKRGTCKNCGMPIRQVDCEFGRIWVHDDQDEDPEAEDYGWVKCLPNENGAYEAAEPASTRKPNVN